MLHSHTSPRSRDRVLADEPRLEPNPDVVAAWTELAIRRMNEVDRDEVKLIPWSVASKRLMAKRKKP